MAKQSGHYQLGLDAAVSVRNVSYGSKPSYSAQVSSAGTESDRASSAAAQREVEEAFCEPRDSNAFGVSGGVAGILYKWVNYGKGWRSRWFLLEDGVLSYYKVHGPDKILMSPAREKGVTVIGEDSLRYMKKANWNRNRLGLPARRPCKPFSEVHLKVSSIRASKSDDKRLSIFTGTKTLHLCCLSREDRAAWIEALLAAKDLFPRVLSSNDLVPSEDIVVSTEKLRLRLAQEGVGEPVIKDCESIMLLEVSELQNQLKALQSKHVMLLDTLRQLETQKIELETTVVDETKERESYCSQGNRRHSDFYSVMSEGSGSDSDAENESQDGGDVETDEDEGTYFDTYDILSSDALRSASYRSREDALRSASYRSRDGLGNGGGDSLFFDRLHAV
ncbi:hypothetical protein ABKV19_013774 [Rosa sericea]